MQESLNNDSSFFDWAAGLTRETYDSFFYNQGVERLQLISSISLEANLRSHVQGGSSDEASSSEARSAETRPVETGATETGPVEGWSNENSKK